MNWLPIFIFFHILGAVVWLGGMIFLVSVMVPVVRRSDQEAAYQLLRQAARRFLILAWGGLALLVGSGIGNVMVRGVNPVDVITGTTDVFGNTLQVKLLLVLLVLLLSGLHDFVLGPRLSRRLEQQKGAAHKEKGAIRGRAVVSWIARVNLLLALIIVALGVAVARGFPW